MASSRHPECLTPRGGDNDGDGDGDAPANDPSRSTSKVKVLKSFVPCRGVFSHATQMISDLLKDDFHTRYVKHQWNITAE